MIFKLHYWFLSSGANALGVLMGVFLETYTDANSIEIGTLLMLMPFTGILFKPLICSKADRDQAHQKYLIICLLIVALGYVPFVIIPLLGPSVYVEHSRICWYILVVLKVIGDVAFGGVISIGDSLAINYSNRIGVEFSVYRVWGTISWMVFGIIIGHVNEVWFLPKYVPGFIILISSSLLDLFIIWLWPKEYFIMVPSEQKCDEKPKDKTKSFTKSLLPREVVWNHMKLKLKSLITFTCSRVDDFAIQSNEVKHEQAIIDKEANIDKSVNGLHMSIMKTEKTQRSPKENYKITKMTQVKLLALLLRRDPRITLYLIFFVCAGMNCAPISFLFMSLSNVCHENDACDFSQLAGLLQVSMAVAETLTFIVIKRVQNKVGRVNLCALSLAYCAVEFLFYGLVWYKVSPYWALLIECLHGAAFGIYLTLMVELGHKFANEVQYIIPELLDRGIIKNAEESESIKLALAATMQSLVSCAMDGIGRGLGSLLYGIILHHYSFQVLWLFIGYCSLTFMIITLCINLLDFVFDFRLGLDYPLKTIQEDAYKIEDAKCKE